MYTPESAIYQDVSFYRDESPERFSARPARLAARFTRSPRFAADFAARHLSHRHLWLAYLEIVPCSGTTLGFGSGFALGSFGVSNLPGAEP